MDGRRSSNRAAPVVLVALVTVLSGWLSGTSGVAVASCARLPPLDEALDRADTVFVGTVVELDNDGRWATFDVEEIWKGGDLPSRVSVKAGPGPGAGSSVDRTYELGIRYLVVPTGAAGATMEDNACTSTRPYTDELDPLRPASTRTPASGTEEVADGVPVWSVLLLLIVAAVAGATALAVRSRRTLN